MTKLPVLIDDNQSPNNLNVVVKELNKKMKKISKTDCANLQCELEKGVKNGFMIAALWAESIPTWAATSNALILELKQGDQVGKISTEGIE